jgi:hypothetical protein
VPENGAGNYHVQFNWGDDNHWYAGTVRATPPGSGYPLELVGTKPAPYATPGTYHVVAYITGPDGTAFTRELKALFVKPQAKVEVQYLPIQAYGVTVGYHMTVIVTNPENGRFRLYFGYPQDDRNHKTYLYVTESAEYPASHRAALGGDLVAVRYADGLSYADMNSLFHKLEGGVLMKHLPYAQMPEYDPNPLAVTSDTYAAYLIRSIGGTLPYSSSLSPYPVTGVTDEYVNRLR